jgi:hypothetical protein
MTLQSPFLALPLELRYAIYSHLISTEPISYPWRFSPITSIDIRPPPVALQLTCRSLSAELQSFYYGKATLRFVNPTSQPIFNNQNRAASLKAIRLTKKVEIVLIWNPTLQVKTKTFRGAWSRELRLPGLVKLLLEEAKNLELVIVTVKDAAGEEKGWEEKVKTLKPLAELALMVRLVVGEVSAADHEEEHLKQQLKAHVSELNARSLRSADRPNEAEGGVTE